MEFKGKWSISTEVAGNLKHTKIHNQQGIAIASMHRLPFSEKQLEYNAKLISKSPEMLEALNGIVNYLEDVLNEIGSESLEKRTAIVLSRQLIKEATTI